MDKITQVIDMVEHPERYSESQISAFLQDEECRQTYLTMMEMRMAFDKEATDKNMKIDEEWQKFADKHPQAHPLSHLQAHLASLENSEHRTFKKSLLHLSSWQKVAASLVGIVMLSGIAFAAIHTFSSHRQPEKVAVSDTTKVKVSTQRDTISRVSNQKKDMVAKKEVVHKTFDDVTLDNMLGEMARYYGVKVVFRNEEVKQLRFYYEWNSENSLQQVVDELNNSQQMNISFDNDELVIE